MRLARLPAPPLAAAFAGVALALAASLPAVAANDACTTVGFFELADRPSELVSPCVVRRDAPLFETGYYQNASRVGGTALASYPDVRLRYGIAPGVELFADAPSAIAKSGLGGKGIYTSQQAGYGFKWRVGSTTRLDYGLHAELTPPNTATSIMDAKERYEIGFDGLLLVTPRVQLGANLDLDDGRRYGRLNASDLAVREAISLGYSVSNSTRVAAEAATETGSRHSRAAAHTIGDVFVQQRLSKRTMFDVELGTSFNTIRGGTKPHYLGSGLVFEI